MKRERNSVSSDRRPLLSSRSAALIRATAIRAALVATVFGCTASAIAGDHDKAAATPKAPNEPHLTTASRIKQWFQTGQASWYGLKFQGHRTATGETYDMNALTCAHPTLPLGSWVRVTNLRNRKTVLLWRPHCRSFLRRGPRCRPSRNRQGEARAGQPEGS
jgi:rare lipoprotein A